MDVGFVGTGGCRERRNRDVVGDRDALHMVQTAQSLQAVPNRRLAGKGEMVPRGGGSDDEGWRGRVRAFMGGFLSMSTNLSGLSRNLALLTGATRQFGIAGRSGRWAGARGLLCLSSAACAAAVGSMGACTHSAGGRELYLESRADPIEVIEVAGETRVVTWPWIEGDVGTFAALPGSGSRPLASRSSRAAEFVELVQPRP